VRDRRERRATEEEKGGAARAGDERRGGGCIWYLGKDLGFVTVGWARLKFERGLDVEARRLSWAWAHFFSDRQINTISAFSDRPINVKYEYL
jgi:hypothetical protein